VSVIIFWGSKYAPIFYFSIFPGRKVKLVGTLGRERGSKKFSIVFKKQTQKNIFSQNLSIHFEIGPVRTTNHQPPTTPPLHTAKRFLLNICSLASNNRIYYTTSTQ